MTSEVGEVREINELFQLILNRSTEIVKAEQASLLILDEATKQLHVKACKGISENVIKNIHVQAGDGIAGKVIQTGKPLLVKDIEKDPRIYQKKKMRYKTSSFISIPLILNERPIGVLNISDKITGEVFNNDDLKIIQIFATQVAIALERTQLYQRSKEMEQVLITDHLTGLLNRRYFFERITEELSRSQRHSHPLSLMMIDVDDFKWYNDHHGHLAGDDALRNVAAVLRDAVRNIDFVARYGGEEFVMVLPQTSKEEAVVIGERLRHEVEKFYFPYEEKQPNGNFTISMGLATYPEDAKGIKNLIEAADKALYRAKAAGKNRLCLFRPPEKGSAE
jgi:diguanylate cyclase (GGDEF)-like protein